MEKEEVRTEVLEVVADPRRNSAGDVVEWDEDESTELFDALKNDTTIPDSVTD